jgi:short-subunit dehydrogenase
MRSLVIGASAGLGRALSTQLAEQGHDLYLVASDERDLEPIACDLRLRFGVKIFYYALDLNEFDANKLYESVKNSLRQLDNLFYVAGYTCLDHGKVEDAIAEKLLNVNMLAPIRIINLFLQDADSIHNIVGIGATAAARPRRQNAIYGSAKRGMEFYFDTLRHFLAFKRCSVQFYRVGYLNTRMTFGMKLLFSKAEPCVIARKIIKGLGKEISTKYLPKWWFFIMLAYQLLPKAMHNRIDV